MNLRSLANQILDQCDEIEHLQHRNFYLEKELAKHDKHLSDYLALQQETFGKILSAATDPDNSINKRMRGEVTQ